MTYSLSVTKQVTESEVPGRTQAFRVLMSATVVAGFVDSGVFRFIRVPEGDLFTGICCPQDLVDYALDVPNPEGWMRKSAIDLVFSHRVESLTIAAEIEAELQTLCNEMEKLTDDLSTAVVTVITSDA